MLSAGTSCQCCPPVALMSQVYVIDGESKVGDAVKAAEAEVGAPVKVTGFARFAGVAPALDAHFETMRSWLQGLP